MKLTFVRNGLPGLRAIELNLNVRDDTLGRHSESSSYTGVVNSEVKGGSSHSISHSFSLKMEDLLGSNHGSSGTMKTFFSDAKALGSWMILRVLNCC